MVPIGQVAELAYHRYVNDRARNPAHLFYRMTLS
jgi:hypothetical protein